MCVLQVLVKYSVIVSQVKLVNGVQISISSIHCSAIVIFLYKINLKLKYINFAFQTFIFKEIKRKDNLLYVSHILFSSYSMSSCRFEFPCLTICCSAGRQTIKRSSHLFLYKKHFILTLIRHSIYFLFFVVCLTFIQWNFELQNFAIVIKC